ncbi:MAG: hypothetical protein ACI9Q9_001268 [Flavobacterium sp.]|jgi:hypothetical protein
MKEIKMRQEVEKKKAADFNKKLRTYENGSFFYTFRKVFP